MSETPKLILVNPVLAINPDKISSVQVISELNKKSSPIHKVVIVMNNNDKHIVSTSNSYEEAREDFLQVVGNIINVDFDNVEIEFEVEE